MQTDYQTIVDRLSRYREVVHEAARAYAAVARTDKSLSPAARAIAVQTCDTFLRTNDVRHLERFVNGCVIIGSRNNWRDLNSIEGSYVIRRSARWIGVSACKYILLPLIPEGLLEEVAQEKARLEAQKAEAGAASQAASEGTPEPAIMPPARKGRRGGRSKKSEAHAPA